MRVLVRVLVFVVLTCLSSPALADACGELAQRVSLAAGGDAGERDEDFVSFAVSGDVTVTLSCSAPPTVSAGAGALHRGEDPPETFYRLFGRVGQIVTGVAADSISAAAQHARAHAPRLNHSNIAADGALVTCALSSSAAGEPLTMCAVTARPRRG